MKPSKDLDEQIEEILEGVFSQGVRAGKDIALEKYEDYSAWKRGDEKQQLLALIEQRELQARIDELEATSYTEQSSTAKGEIRRVMSKTLDDILSDRSGAVSYDQKQAIINWHNKQTNEAIYGFHGFVMEADIIRPEVDRVFNYGRLHRAIDDYIAERNKLNNSDGDVK